MSERNYGPLDPMTNPFARDADVKDRYAEVITAAPDASKKVLTNEELRAMVYKRLPEVVNGHLEAIRRGMERNAGYTMLVYARDNGYLSAPDDEVTRLRERVKELEGRVALFDRMEAICKRRYRDGDAPYFRTFGMLSEDDGQFLVRINRMFLHKSTSLFDAVEMAVKEWEESGDPNDQMEPLPNTPDQP